MTEIEPVRLSAEGFPACAQPEQVPKNGLMEQYLKVRNDPNVIHIQEAAKVGTSETLILDGKPLYTTQLMTRDQMAAENKKNGLPPEAIPTGDILDIYQLGSGRSDRYENDARTVSTFMTKDADGRDVVTEANLKGATVTSEFIWRGSDSKQHPISSINFSDKGTPSEVICMTPPLQTSYTYHMPFDSTSKWIMQDLDVAFRKATSSPTGYPYLIMPY